ncbi:phospholipase A2 inhibitor and Ly6/PLAUR domain-containing protein-like [Python bivittatus]|uniref:Phospholipase A2 inhibitor and Ly6/PLAUR domain-containing protein-like n=1 Tax=Python bivittatus TaxID=176946 RepID=A0A9F2RF70_PYTBI|nr:phospholipase A2 inhibitor and Ly6/PLAUR domain-containing protein-like [Python bivittatus]
MLMCAPGKDRCSVTYLRTPFGISQIIKSCVPSIVCDKGIQVINLGRTGTVVVQLTCCERDECRRVVPPALPEKTVPNGKQCPACFSLQKKCNEDVAYCNGDELYCAAGFLDSGIGNYLFRPTFLKLHLLDFG